MKTVIFLAGMLSITTPSLANVSPSACAAVGGNLVTNCGFETGDLTGWSTYTGGTVLPFVSGNGAYAPHSGSYYAQVGPGTSYFNNRAVFLSQQFSVFPALAQTINVYGSFYFQSNGLGGDMTVYSDGGGLLLILPLPTTTDWIQYQFTGQEPGYEGGSINFNVSYDTDGLLIGLDDVVVTEAATPEPGRSLGLLLAGGLGILWLARRRFEGHPTTLCSAHTSPTWAAKKAHSSFRAAICITEGWIPAMSQINWKSLLRTP